MEGREWTGQSDPQDTDSIKQNKWSEHCKTFLIRGEICMLYVVWTSKYGCYHHIQCMSDGVNISFTGRQHYHYLITRVS